MPSESTPWRRFLEYVTAPPPPKTAESGRIPGAVTAAFYILLGCGALQIASAFYDLAHLGSDLNYVVVNRPKNVTEAQVRSFFKPLLIGNVIFLAVIGGLYAMFGFMVRQGRRWARIVLTIVVVVFGLLTVLTGGLSLITEVSLLIEVIAVALLYTPTARDFFAAHRKPPNTTTP
jgi:hypothetical protein